MTCAGIQRKECDERIHVDEFDTFRPDYRSGFVPLGNSYLAQQLPTKTCFDVDNERNEVYRAPVSVKVESTTGVFSWQSFAFDEFEKTVLAIQY